MYKRSFWENVCESEVIEQFLTSLILRHCVLRTIHWSLAFAYFQHQTILTLAQKSLPFSDSQLDTKSLSGHIIQVQHLQHTFYNGSCWSNQEQEQICYDHEPNRVYSHLGYYLYQFILNIFIL